MKRFLSLFLCVVLILHGCGSPEPEGGTLFYYQRGGGTVDDIFAPEPRQLGSLEGNLDAILSLYCAGPVQDGLTNPLPPDAVILGWSLADRTLTLHFDSSLAQLSGIELTVAAGCLARTFLELTGAEILVLTADGALLRGETALRLELSDLSLRDNALDRLHQCYTVYYASPDNRYLIGHEVSIHTATGEELPMQLLELLLTAPQGSGLHSALPVGTRILSARVEDGLCTVDLSSEFERRRFYGISAQCLSLLSIVNTLTVLDAIDRVEFTVEGNLVIQYGQIPIGAPLVRDERCIGPVRTGLGERDATIYLAQAGSRLLLPVPARLTQSGGMPLPELVVRCILQDPGSNGIQSCISPGTVLNAISVRNGTCTVDLSAAYLTEPQNLTASGRVIAASLCSLDGIDRVQLLVDGTIPEGFDRALFGPLVPQEDWFL